VEGYFGGSLLSWGVYGRKDIETESITYSLFDSLPPHSQPPSSLLRESPSQVMLMSKTSGTVSTMPAVVSLHSTISRIDSTQCD